MKDVRVDEAAEATTAPAPEGRTPRLSLIAAMGLNHVIGDGRAMPWHLPADLRRFRSLTWGKPILMGRRTFASLGKPLPGRENIVLSRGMDESAAAATGARVTRDIGSALALARQGAADEVFVIGGGEVYRQLLPRADRVYLTVVQGEFVGGVTFPFEELAALEWTLRHREDVPADERNPHPHRFVILERLRGGSGQGRKDEAFDVGRLLAEP